MKNITRTILLSAAIAVMTVLRTHANDQLPEPSAFFAEQQNQTAEASIEKTIVYKSVTNLELGSEDVLGATHLPPDFALYRVGAPEVQSLMNERLNFKFSTYNPLAR